MGWRPHACRPRRGVIDVGKATSVVRSLAPPEQSQADREETLVKLPRGRGHRDRDGRPRGAPVLDPTTQPPRHDQPTRRDRCDAPWHRRLPRTSLPVRRFLRHGDYRRHAGLRRALPSSRQHEARRPQRPDVQRSATSMLEVCGPLTAWRDRSVCAARLDERPVVLQWVGRVAPDRERVRSALL